MTAFGAASKRKLQERTLSEVVAAEYGGGSYFAIAWVSGEKVREKSTVLNFNGGVSPLDGGNGEHFMTCTVFVEIVKYWYCTTNRVSLVSRYWTLDFATLKEWKMENRQQFFQANRIIKLRHNNIMSPNVIIMDWNFFFSWCTSQWHISVKPESLPRNAWMYATRRNRLLALLLFSPVHSLTSDYLMLFPLLSIENRWLFRHFKFHALSSVNLHLTIIVYVA